jgi:hypothetical protein
VTFYASLSVSEDILQAICRWSSSAWNIYIQEHPTIRMEHQLALLCHPFMFRTPRAPILLDHHHPPHTSYTPEIACSLQREKSKGASRSCGVPVHTTYLRTQQRLVIPLPMNHFLIQHLVICLHKGVDKSP